MTINEDFVDWITNQFDEDYEYNSKRKELESRDFRIEKPRTVDIDAEYKEFKNFEKSDTYKNVLRATQLLSDKWDISGDQLKVAMQSSYNLSDADCNDILKNMANSKHVDMREGIFDRKIKLRLK